MTANHIHNTYLKISILEYLPNFERALSIQDTLAEPNSKFYGPTGTGPLQIYSNQYLSNYTRVTFPLQRFPHRLGKKKQEFQAK